MTSYFSDFKVGVRQMFKRPGEMVLAATAYAVGLGLVGLMLTLLYGVVKAHPEGIDFDEIQVLTWDPTTSHLWKSGSQTGRISYADFLDIQERQDVFESLAVLNGATFNVTIDHVPERFFGQYVTEQFFDVFGIAPLRGSFFQSGDSAPSSGRKVVISNKFWQTKLNGRTNVIGESLTINGTPTVIIGVAPKDFDFPARNDVWLNERTDPSTVKRGEGELYDVFGRLPQGREVSAAMAGLNVVAKQLESEYPQTNTGYIAFDVRPLSAIHLGENFSIMVYLMLACASLVLLIACTNVANLTLSRATARVKELAIRSSLGGSRARLVFQMVTEGLAIALLGGVGGLIIAIWSSSAVWAWSNKGDANTIPEWMNMNVDGQVMLTMFLATLAASILASIVPALKASRADVSDILKDQSRGSSGLRIGHFSKFLAFLQLAVSCGLLIATSALVSTSRVTTDFELPYDPSGMMVARFDLPADRHPPETLYQDLQRLVGQLENNPALQGVGLTSSVDLLQNWQTRWEARGSETVPSGEYIAGRHEIVSNNYFQLLGIPLLAGRSFESVDAGTNAQQVCVINEFLAEAFWPGNIEAALGKQIRDAWVESNAWITIVGIVPDTNMAGPGLTSQSQRAGVYRPMSLSPQASVSIFARTRGDPLIQANHIRAALRSIDESVALYRVKTVEEAIKDANFGSLFFRNMFALFGLAALALAAIGTYGVMDFSVRQRFQEFGIRRALGASESTIMGIVAKMGGVQIALGIAVGTVMGTGLIVALRTIAGGVIVESINYIIPILTVLLISGIALYLPTRYALAQELSKSLHEE